VRFSDGVGSFSFVHGEQPTENVHLAFGVGDIQAVEEFHRVAISAGQPDNGPPGERPEYHPGYHGAFVLDPDGNSVELVHHHRVSPDAAVIDHLWLRSPDVAAARRFYETVAPVVGIRPVHDSPERVRFSDGIGSFSFVHGDQPTENVHLAFGVGDIPAVEEFHRAATTAGYPDNGPPGERPEYHPGYHGAFVLDPDGHNVEAVFHDRRG
jgi:catechol 2,3-dioxygenase-like lactoylglutathione lyase family enzyme